MGANKEDLTRYISEPGSFVIAVDSTRDDRDSVVSMYMNHSTFHAGDAGLDLFCTKRQIIPKRSLGNKIDLGIVVQSGHSYWMLPRSSISKTPLRLSNSVGLIDAGYRGNLMAMVDNHSDEDYIIEEKQRLFQIATGDLRGPIFGSTG